MESAPPRCHIYVVRRRQIATVRRGHAKRADQPTLTVMSFTHAQLDTRPALCRIRTWDHCQSGRAVSPTSTGIGVMPEPSARITKSPGAENTMWLPSGDHAGV